MAKESSKLAKAPGRSGKYATVESPDDVDAATSNTQAAANCLDAANILDEIQSTPLGMDRHSWQRRILLVSTLLLSMCVLLLCVYIRNQQETIQALKTSSKITGDNPTISNENTLNWLPLPSSDTVMTKIAFGSCARQDMPQPYWDTLVSFQPQLVLLMGDNIYGDCDDSNCTKLFQAYNDFAKHPSVQGAAKQFPVFATLDDHDYGQGDCHADNPYKEIARRKFASFYNIDWKELPKNDGVYRSRIFGPPGRQLQIILLDTRYGRSPFQETKRSTAPYTPITDPDMPQQMLSERQWKWLANELDKPADLRVIVSSIQVMNDVCVFESWRQLPRERQRLYNLLQPHRNVILLSGDRHVGAFLTSENGGLTEVTASSWTHAIPFGAYGSNCSTSEECDEADPRRIGNLVRDNHFGSLEIDWESREYMVALRKAETSYGTMYRHKWSSDAGFVIQSHNYTISSI
ncbi:hypothetical protein MPSEU_000685400 [Mayamaea pseudoterrestris]|nr:hypothetical protein MPSEU_000685400 [Mayamaea pseudoterrestris]